MATAAIGSINPQLLVPPDPNRVPMKTLGQDEFLQLLVAQLTNQDPLNPKNDTEFIAQMAQFSALEQSKAMQQNMATMQASGLIDRSVELRAENGTTVRGTVTSVTVEAGTPKLIVNGTAYGLQQLVAIQPATSTSLSQNIKP